MKEFATTIISMPTNPIQFHGYKRENSKAKRIILNSMRDNIIPHITKKNTIKEIVTQPLLIPYKTQVRRRLITMLTQDLRCHYGNGVYIF